MGRDANGDVGNQSRGGSVEKEMVPSGSVAGIGKVSRQKSPAVALVRPEPCELYPSSAEQTPFAFFSEFITAIARVTRCNSLFAWDKGIGQAARPEFHLLSKFPPCRLVLMEVRASRVGLVLSIPLLIWSFYPAVSRSRLACRLLYLHWSGTETRPASTPI